MTDQELLRLAALAAGYELKWSNEWPGGGCFMRRVVPEPEHPGSKWVPWRPLNDDGDALRLAVALELYLNLGAFGTIIYLKNGKLEEIGDDGCDAMALCRRAIVRAAAEIGQRMEGEPT